MDSWEVAKYVSYTLTQFPPMGHLKYILKKKRRGHRMVYNMIGSYLCKNWSNYIKLLELGISGGMEYDVWQEKEQMKDLHF